MSKRTPDYVKNHNKQTKKGVIMKIEMVIREEGYRTAALWPVRCPHTWHGRFDANGLEAGREDGRVGYVRVQTFLLSPIHKDQDHQEKSETQRHGNDAHVEGYVLRTGHSYTTERERQREALKPHLTQTLALYYRPYFRLVFRCLMFSCSTYSDLRSLQCAIFNFVNRA